MKGFSIAAMLLVFSIALVAAAPAPAPTPAPAPLLQDGVVSSFLTNQVFSLILNGMYSRVALADVTKRMTSDAWAVCV
jgi:predicted cobalt transporter CbtA